MWDVRGGFQNAMEDAVISRCQQSKKANWWTGYLRDFFRVRDFTVESGDETDWVSILQA